MKGHVKLEKQDFGKLQSSEVRQPAHGGFKERLVVKHQVSTVKLVGNLVLSLPSCPSSSKIACVLLST